MRIIYGINPVLEALRRGNSTIENIFMAAGRKKSEQVSEIVRLGGSKKVSITSADPGKLSEISGTKNHQGVVAVIKGGFNYVEIEDLIEQATSPGKTPLIMLLDSIKDPQNLGSIIRAALGSGADGVIIPKDRACEVTATVVKASAGATEHTAISMVTNLSAAIEKLKEAGIWVAAIEADGEDDIFKSDLTGPMALVIGSEGEGIRPLVRKRCDMALRIPLGGEVGSLNAAQAATISLFEARRQRG